MSPCRAMPTGTRTFQSSICTFSAGTQQVWSLEIESQIESLSIWSHRHLISCLQEWEVFLSPRQGRLDPPKKDGWSAPWNQKHPTSNIWETLKSLQAYNSPPKNGVMNPCLVENYQMIFWYYCWWSKSSRSAPWSWAWKAGNHREVGRLQSWCAEKNGLLGQGFIFFCGGICGEKKTLLHFHFHCLFFESWGSTTFTWLATVSLGQKEVWRTMTIHHLTRKVRKYSTSRSILTANEWTQWRFFSSAMALVLKKIASLCWCCVASAISIVFGAWLGSSLDQLGMSMLLQAFCVVASVLGHVLHCFPHHFLSESVLVPDGLLPLSPSLIRPKTCPPP